MPVDVVNAFFSSTVSITLKYAAAKNIDANFIS